METTQYRPGEFQPASREYLAMIATRVPVDSAIYRAIEAVGSRLGLLPEHMQADYQHLADKNVTLTVEINTDLKQHVVATMSEPLFMVDILNVLNIPSDAHILEIGTGVGYNAALLAQLVPDGQVTTIDRSPDLVERARSTFAIRGYKNITVLEGDGLEGFVEGAPYDVIIVAGGARDRIPLIEQLGVGKQMVVPMYSDYRMQVGEDIENPYDLLLVTKISEANEHTRRLLTHCSYTPLVSGLPGGWKLPPSTQREDQKDQ